MPKQGATVYLLRSLSHPDQPYIGLSQSRISERLRRHNHGDVPATARYRPWRIEAALWFRSRKTAAHFERYLKSGSGRAFAKRHF